AAQPESSDTTPQNLGDFTTGTHLAAVSYTGTGFAEDISTMETTGNLYMAKTQFIILHGLKTDDLPDSWSVTGPDGFTWILATGETANRVQSQSGKFSFFAKRLTSKPGSLSVGIVPESDFPANSTEFSCDLASGFEISGVFTFKLID
ncbi:MAG: hypothetical protein AB2792_21955, partial [Candidatus Thiodiazotropha sp.]